MMPEAANLPRLTLEEAKAEIQKMKRQYSGVFMVSFVLRNALNILNRVKPEPDEEGQAVLWLMREKGWAISQEHGQWVRVTFTSDGFFDFHTIVPIDEVKKLRLGGQDV